MRTFQSRPDFIERKEWVSEEEPVTVAEVKSQLRFVFDNEAGQHDVNVPEFEIDAQPAFVGAEGAQHVDEPGIARIFPIAVPAGFRRHRKGKIDGAARRRRGAFGDQRCGNVVGAALQRLAAHDAWPAVRVHGSMVGMLQQDMHTPSTLTDSVGQLHAIVHA